MKLPVVTSKYQFKLVLGSTTMFRDIDVLDGIDFFLP